MDMFWQTGFGWSNGVVLSFLEEFGWPEDKEIACSGKALTTGWIWSRRRAIWLRMLHCNRL